MSDKVIEQNMLDLFIKDSQTYGAAVNIGRVTPGIDGLKPVQRRILYAMGVILKLTPSHKFVKSSAVIGEVMKTLHPHGDSSIYQTLVRMGNWFDTYYPLIDKQGSFGTFQGLPAAAHRYTECKLNEFMMDIAMSELIELPNITDYDPNFDYTSQEPILLPTKIPLPLIQGITGIGFGMKVYLPPHNLKEVIDETIKLIKDPTYNVYLEPDQCQECTIIGDEFNEISFNGVGKYIVRGNIEIEETKKSHKLIITSLPDQVYLDTVVESIQKLVSTGKIIGIHDMIDQSQIALKPNDPDIMRYVITLKPGTDPNYIKEILYANTDIQKSFSISFQLINGVTPVRYNYTTYLEKFIEFRSMTKFRYYNIKLSTCNTKLHEIDAFIKVLESGYIDEIIKMIRSKDQSTSEIMEFLIDKCKITDIQAKFILNTRIANLSARKLGEYKSSYNDLTELINHYRMMISNPDAIFNEMIEELTEISRKYGQGRKCKVLKGKKFSNVPEGEFKIVIDNFNNIRKINKDDIGSNKFGSSKLEVVMSNRDDLILFDSNGKVFSFSISKIPLIDKNSQGVNIKTLIKSIGDVIYIIPKERLEEFNKFKPDVPNLITMLIVTKSGLAKRITLPDLINAPKSGTIYSKLNNKDKVLKIVPISASSDIYITSKNKSIRLNTENVMELKRNSLGSRTIDDVMSVSITDPSKYLSLIMTSDGKGNLINNTGIAYGKNPKSVIKTGTIVSIVNVTENDTVIIETLEGDIEINISDIKMSSTASSGVQLIPKKSIITNMRVR